MTTQGKQNDRITLMQGTLDVLILRILLFGKQHGQGIARAIQATSEDVLLVDHGSLYPALQRLERKKWIKAAWGVSSNNRKARFYELTKAGRTQLFSETERWERLVAAMGRGSGQNPGAKGRVGFGIAPVKQDVPVFDPDRRRVEPPGTACGAQHV